MKTLDEYIQFITTRLKYSSVRETDKSFINRIYYYKLTGYFYPRTKIEWEPTV